MGNERGSRRPWVAALTAILAIGAACATFTVYRIDALSVPNKSGKLKNGLKVAIQPDPDQALVQVKLRYSVGAANEPKDKKGLAHLVEHLAFRLGDELVEIAPPAKTDADLDLTPAAKADAKPKDAEPAAAKPQRYRRVHYLTEENAWTLHDETVYWKRVPPANLHDVLQSFASQMGDFSKDIDPQVFAAEKQVVRNERRTRYEAQPLDRFWPDLFARFYPESHPYRGDVIGSHETIDSITVADLSAFLAAHYHPGNAQLAVVGPIDPKATLDLVMQTFGAKPGRAPSRLADTEWTPAYHEETIVVEDAKQALLTVVWPLGPRFSEEARAMRVLDDAVGGWFHWTLVTNRDWAYWVASAVDESDLESRFVVQALLKDPGDADAAKGKILEIAGLLDSAVKDKDLEVTRRRFIYAKLYEVERLETRSDDMLRYFAALDNPISWMAEINGLEGLNMGEVKQIGRKVLDRDRAFVVLHTPGAAAQPAAKTAATTYSKDAAKKAGDLRAIEENRDRLPPLYDFGQPSAEFLDWSVRGAERWAKASEVTLANGIRCRLLHSGLVPVMSVAAMVNGGALAEPADEHGVAQILVSSVTLSGNADNTYSYRMAREWNYGAEDELLRFTWKIPSVYADRALELAVELLRSPQILRTNVTNARNNMLKDWVTDGSKDADKLSEKAFWKSRGLPALALDPSKKSLAAIGYGDVLAYAERVLYPENVVLAVSSDLPPATLVPMLERTFGSWSKGQQPPQSLDLGSAAAAPLGAAKLVIVDADTAQSSVSVSLDSVGWQRWEERALFDGVSALVHEKAERIRQAMGATYGVGVGNWSWKGYGLFRISAKVERGATAAALRQVLKVIDEVRDSELRADELEFVRRTIIQGIEGRARFSFVDAQHLARLMARGRAPDHDRQVVQWAAKLTLDDLQRAVSELLSRRPLAVVVGQGLSAAELATLPKDLLAEVVRYTPDDIL
ncbi:MAG: insulinase family protein [Deltaproteobacteria bacterium]|nr:insulinase family protein [Deltaproteobacteria bacterium]